MVSLWPWQKDKSSPFSFEKTLSTLSNKIATTQAQVDRARASNRHVRVLSTLYLSFAYLVYVIVALLVVGWKNMGAYEWACMAGGPALIYLFRTVVSAIYELRIEGLGSKLKVLQTERAKTIQKLKDATKYDSTLELLEKYGGGDTKLKERRRNTEELQGDESHQTRQRQQGQNAPTPSRVRGPLPVTANIPRGSLLPAASAGLPPPFGPQSQQCRSGLDTRMDASAEFAPNAFEGPRSRLSPMGGEQSQITAAGVGYHWYDRIMDLLLGEDETAAKNRIVLVCRRCRLVNGQAPPGTTGLAELGGWRCMSCGLMNGQENEGERIVKEVLGQISDASEKADSGEERGVRGAK